MNKINLQEKFNCFSEHWSPKIVGELNGQYIKLARFKGEFVWHQHDDEDEMFMVISGNLTIEFRDKTVTLGKDECIIVPKGTPHKPVAEEEVLVMLFEPASTRNTGETTHALTKERLDWI